MPSMTTKITFLGFDQALTWQFKDSGYLVISLPRMSQVQHVRNAWTLKLTNIT